MAKVKLAVIDSDGVYIVDDEIQGILTEPVTGAKLFSEMNARCEFATWSRADATGENVKFNVMNSRIGHHNAERATRILQDVIDSLGRAGVPCEFTFQVWKKEEFIDPATDSPEGPDYPRNPGLEPLRHGPDGGRVPTVEGPLFARMRGLLTRV